MGAVISPRIVAEVAIEMLRSKYNTPYFKCFRTEDIGRLRAVQSIEPSWEVMSWVNEARFHIYDYCVRHNLEWL